MMINDDKLQHNFCASDKECQPSLSMHYQTLRSSLNGNHMLPVEYATFEGSWFIISTIELQELLIKKQDHVEYNNYNTGKYNCINNYIETQNN